MRLITRLTANALRNGEDLTISNTSVSNGVMNLHGNTIAIYDSIEGLLTIRDSGWRTHTTKERLNGLLSVFNIKCAIIQAKGVWYTIDANGEREEWIGFKVFDV